MNDDEWLTEVQAAARLGISTSSVKELGRRGDLVKRRPTRRAALLATDVDQLLQARRIKPGSMPYSRNRPH